MSEVKIMTDVYISGQKEKIVEVLNNALSSVGMKPIAGKKEISALNRKWHKGQALFFTLLDFMDQATREESPFKEMVPPDWDEDNEDHLYDYELVLSEIVDSGSDYQFSLHESVVEYQESYSFADYCKWCERMTRDYGFRIVLHEVELDSDFSRSGAWSFATSHDSRIFERVDGQVKETGIWPESDLGKYLDAMDKLAKEVGMDECEKMEFIIDDYRTMARKFEREANLWEKKLSDLEEELYGRKESKEQPGEEPKDESKDEPNEDDGLPF